MMIAPSEHDFERALGCANFYRSLGWQPLPSKMNKKAPTLATFAEYWDDPLPERTYAKGEWKTTNIQLMCGARWGLCVVDCDGDEAKAVWLRMCFHNGGCPETWTANTGGGGKHYYFRVPEWADDCPSRRLWGVWDTWAGTNDARPGSPMKGDWQKHKEVRVLGEKALAIAPPSIHVDTGKPYQWAAAWPAKLPAVAPAWLMRMPAIEAPACVENLPPPAFAFEGPSKPAGAFFRREEVLGAIPSKIDVARRWGLRTASQGPDAKGWWRCWAIDRDETIPSSQFHDTDGVYWCGRERTSMSLFDLGVAAPHGGFSTWLECRDALGAEFVLARKAAPPARRRPPARVTNQSSD